MGIDTNLIYRGDCLSVLKREFPDNSVDMVYIDPPFSFDPKYARLWSDRKALEMFEEFRKGKVRNYIDRMATRLEELYRVLKDTGSLYLHCDWKFGHYLKAAMDEIFGKSHFQNELVWLYSGRETSKKRWNRKHDTIFFYTKGKTWTFNWEEVMEPLKESSQKALSRYTDKDGRRFILRYKDGGGFAPLSAEGPDTYRQYVPEGVPPRDWVFIDYSRKSQRVGYSTQKPEALLERIIKVSSNPGDIVLDPMCGCGTTVAVAHKLDRRWIGIDVSSQACRKIKKRMEKLEDIAEVEVRGLPLTIGDLKKLDPFEFQDYLCDMVGAQRARRKVRDMGIDGIYPKGDPKFPLQIKQNKRHPVGRKTVDEFETALRRKGRDKGYIFGFDFTREACEEAARAKGDGLDIKLVTISELVGSDYELEEIEE